MRWRPGGTHQKIVFSVSAAAATFAALGMAVAASAIDGTLDTSFGNLLPRSGTSVVSVAGFDKSTAHAVAVQPDGKIVAVGFVQNTAQVPDLVVLRFQPSGMLDLAFGAGESDGNGVVTIDVPTGFAVANDVVIQPDGKIILAGRMSKSDVPGGTNSLLVRLFTDGTLDSGFGLGGIVNKHTSSLSTGDDEFHSLALQPDGKIIAVGYSQVATGSMPIHDTTITRFHPDGTIDTDFGSATTGIVRVDSSGSGGVDEGHDVTVQPDGKILIAGSATISGSYDSVLVRLTTTGRRDPLFGTAGVVVTDITGPGNNDGFRALTVQADGKLVAGGFRTQSGATESTVVRYHGNGDLDLDFGDDGVVEATVLSKLDSVVELMIQSDRKIVTLNKANGLQDFGLARYHSDGQLDTSFSPGGTDGDGILRATLGDLHGGVVQHDNRIVAVGQTDTTGTWGIRVIRIHATSSAALLTSLAPSESSLSPGFSSSSTAYSATVPNTVKSITLTPTVLDPNSTVAINGVAATSGSPSASLALVPGANTFTVSVRSQDGTVTTTYTVTVTRSFATLKTKKTMTAKNALASADATAPAGAKVKITVARPSKKICAPAGTKIKGLKAGTCSVTIAVTPKRTATVKKPTTTRTQVTIIVN